MKTLDRYRIITWDNTRYYGTSDNPKDYNAPRYIRHGSAFTDWKLAEIYAIKWFGVTRGSYGVGLLDDRGNASVIYEHDAMRHGLPSRSNRRNLVTGGKLP